MRLHLSNRLPKRLLKNQRGFTLIEILVALFLMALVLAITISSPFSSRNDLDKDVNSLERSIRFMSDEAALKNAVVRLHLMLDRTPQEYAVEYGPSDSFILPPTADFETTAETKEEIEKRKKETKSLNQKFNKVQEFQDKNNEMTGEIRIVGVATSQSQKLQTEGEVSIYAFPTGEKDEALVLVASDEDIISLKISPFSMKIDREVQPLGKGDSSDKDIASIQQKKAKEIFEKWQKEK
ncbi:MAG: prepilin-type N-terminal cleavage/methylation domain-containing protein [Bacteriovorax sp.]|jgi:prepilin-type N-terminal cleavage/methylation domain-containing protein